MTLDIRLPPGHDPSKPLKKADDHFCRMLAAGVSLAKAVQSAYGKYHYKNDATRRARGWQLAKDPIFEARVHYLRTLDEMPEYLSTAPAKPAPELDLSRDGLISLMAEITTALSESIRALDGAGAEPRETSRLRADLLLHVKRLDKLRPDQKEFHTAPTDTFASLLAWHDTQTTCTCDQNRPQVAGAAL